MKLTRVFYLFLSLFVLHVASSAQAGNHGSKITTIYGINNSDSGDSCDGGGDLPFLNVLKWNCGWQISNGNSCSGASLATMQTDANGWPTTMVFNGSGGCAATEFFIVANFGGNLTDGSPGFPSGTYVLLHDGTGTFTLSTDCSFVENGGTGRDIYSCSQQGFIKLSITATNGSTPLKNFQLVNSPGSTGNSGGNVVGTREQALKLGELFNPDFLQRMSRFTGVRFMDWFGINTNPTANWSDRTPLGYYTWTYHGGGSGGTNTTLPWGAPPEVGIQLCNELPYIQVCHLNVPIEYTDAAVTSFATLAHNTLRAPIKAAVEYGNEFFNANFSAPLVTYLNAQIAITGSGSINNQGVTRSAQVNDIWESVYGADASTRLIRLLGGQNGFIARNTFFMDYTLPGQFTGAASTHADALTVAPYWDFIGSGYPIAWSAETDPLNKFFLQTNGGDQIPGKPWQFDCPAANCMSIASPAVVTLPSHGLGANTAVAFNAAGNLPGNITGTYGFTPYYVIATGLTTNSFEFSNTQGGSAINTTGSQTGPQIFVAGCTTGGTSLHYTVSSNLANCSANGSFPSTPANGTMVVVNINQTSGNAPDLAVDAGSAFGLTDGDGNALNAVAPGIYVFVLTSAIYAGSVTTSWRYTYSSAVDNGTPPDPITSSAYYFGVNYTNAQARGLGIQCYEGGQNFQTANSTRKTWYITAMYDQRMAASYINWASQIKANLHGGSCMHFNSFGTFQSNGGFWSLQEGITQPLSNPPKYNALSTFN